MYGISMINNFKPLLYEFTARFNTRRFGSASAKNKSEATIFHRLVYSLEFFNKPFDMHMPRFESWCRFGFLFFQSIKLLWFLRFLRPSILQRYCPIKHELAGRAIFVDCKIGKSLELIAQLQLRIFQTWLAFGGHHFQ